MVDEPTCFSLTTSKGTVTCEHRLVVLDWQGRSLGAVVYNEHLQKWQAVHPNGTFAENRRYDSRVKAIEYLQPRK